MEALNILSAGAAQAVVAPLAHKLQLESPVTVNVCYGAVQSMKSRVLVGEPVDVIVLTDALLDELVLKNLVVSDSRTELGTVGTGLAVRAGTPVPDVASLQALRENLLAAEKIVCPDPAVATAGKVLLTVLDRLGISEQTRPRLLYCSSGLEAVAWLAQGTGPREIGVMQMTEIIAGADMALAGPLPAELQSQVIYSAGLAVRSRSPERAREFMRRLAGDRHALRVAGFGSGQGTGNAETTI
ncbi:MAG: substrate-binding domain-containing protein [Polaromonas sp.]|uniref:molybdate ABC transporter substrate-binding protein n=1 Tax=Polaromonas sp. TaxID=1869339 RepID=UPI002732483C|nr:substrate-binding domain-containing protein [Polaromonas sp.]MDP3799558.1 substrate-binding domain-containing protein [Polaromonas sp.]